MTESGLFKHPLKTLFLAEYLRLESLRREIHEGLQVIENWNSANDFILYGKGGEFASNKLENQEILMPMRKSNTTAAPGRLYCHR